ncbi:hypothetical protein BPAE_0170g00200 [Botrytis paeoniae]|uniref:Uncharacterized protein n=1 Tax=Botrytis paeoniae TaxID=278948 RepID=A0A4Z1FL41_9HELO|nr:hypothetical protein BPAE_0170g00200 [Botrytis paeoniae]
MPAFTVALLYFFNHIRQAKLYFRSVKLFPKLMTQGNKQQENEEPKFECALYDFRFQDLMISHLHLSFDSTGLSSLTIFDVPSDSNSFMKDNSNAFCTLVSSIDALYGVPHERTYADGGNGVLQFGVVAQAIFTWSAPEGLQVDANLMPDLERKCTKKGQQDQRYHGTFADSDDVHYQCCVKRSHRIPGCFQCNVKVCTRCGFHDDEDHAMIIIDN